MTKHTAEIFQGQDGDWYWHVKAGNGEIIAQSEGYTREGDALRGLEAAEIVYDSVSVQPTAGGPAA